jgi:hypothetical protein
MVGADVGFLAYWSAVGLHLLPASVMFPDYTDPRVVAWNWSFLPLDVAASATGLAAAHLLRRGGAAVATLLPVSLALTAAAGGLAVAYWLLRGQVDPFWLAPNLVLLAFPLPLLARLLRHGPAVVTVVGRPAPGRLGC